MNYSNNALSYFETHFTNYLDTLVEFSKIPSVSFPGFPPQYLEASAAFTAHLLRNAGLENVEVLKIPDAPPYVYAEWLHAPHAPTLLIYGHHDVQPPGREDKWESKPFVPTQRGDRLFGRGTADDKGGVMIHVVAIESILKSMGSLPVNVKFIIEGEEETGSQHLGDFLKTYQNKLQADAMVLSDTANLDVGLPSLTYRLRGIVDGTVELRCLDHPVHSGMWGGPVPDAITALTQLLAKLVDADGKILIPNFYEDVETLSEQEKSQLNNLPFDETQFRKELGSVKNLKWIGRSEKNIYERIWCDPAIAVLGMDVPAIANTSNKLVEYAKAKISIRIANFQDPQKIMQQLENFLLTQAPWGCEVTFTPGVANPGWKMTPQGPMFRAMEQALEKGYGRKAVYIGCGGSIPFVKPLTEAFPEMPALLVGVEDPYTNAHGENESLHLGDWKKAIRSMIYFFSSFNNAKG